MKLNKVSARGLKGLDFTLELGTIAFLVGSNFAGKSARTDAIRLLLLGYLPELGKTPRATFQLCAGREMVVEGWFDDGTHLRRRWFLKGDTVKTETECTGPSAEHWLGASGESQFAVMLNAEVYFALSDRERVNYVFENIAIDSEGGENTQDKIGKVLRTEVGGLDHEAVAEFLGALDSEKCSIEREQGRAPWTRQSFVEFALEFASEAQKRQRSAAVVFDKTAQGLAHIRAAEQAPLDAAKLDKDRERLNNEIRDLQDQKTRHTVAYDQSKVNRRRRQELHGEVTALPRFKQKASDLAADRQLRKAAFDALPVGGDDQLDQERVDLNGAQNSVRDHERQLREVDESIGRNGQEILRLSELKACPCCGASGDGWKDGKIAEINSAIAGLTVKKNQIAEHLPQLRSHAQSIERRIERLRADILARREAENALRNVERDVESTEKQIAVLEAKAEELAGIPAEDPEITAKVETIQTELNVKRDELYRVENARNLHIGRSHDLRRLAEAEKARDDAKMGELVAKEAANALREIQARMVADAFAPMLRDANLLCGEILKTPIAYRDGEIGTWRGGAWVPHATFSGTEKALAYAAIQAALAAKSPVRIMIIDELARLDTGNASKLVRALAELAEKGKIDQFVGIDTGRSELYRTEAEMTDVVLTLEAVS